jgi:hypothetical protein
MFHITFLPFQIGACGGQPLNVNDQPEHSAPIFVMISHHVQPTILLSN